ncbi:MAG TPA: phosphotransferase [Terracidiphilus sp.]|nr:phosphotransferase [Terracidiphilus sp.]
MSETVKAHGLDGTLVAPDWPPLNEREVRQILPAFGLRGPFEILSASPRPLSAASMVSIRDGQVFIKRHARSVRDAEGLREEHRFMEHLRENGAPVPRVLRTDSGESAVEVDGWTYEAHEPAAGIDLYEDAISWTPFRSTHHARSAGEMMARLHLAAQGYDASPRTGRPLVAGFSIFSAADPAMAMQRYVDARPALRAYMEQRRCAEDALNMLASCHEELATQLPHLAPLWTHNDFHASNLFWSGAGDDAQATAVIDFGLCDRTNAVHDLAQAVDRSIVEWLVLVNDSAQPENVPIHFEHLGAMLEGYESVRPLSQTEALALASMTALCHVEFALSETDYFLDVLHSTEKAWFGCEGYLVLHSYWWRGPGEKLLNWLRAWAVRREGADIQ